MSERPCALRVSTAETAQLYRQQRITGVRMHLRSREAKQHHIPSRPSRGALADVIIERSRFPVIRYCLLYVRLSQLQPQENPRTSLAPDWVTLGTNGGLTQSTSLEHSIPSLICGAGSEIYLLRNEFCYDRSSCPQDIDILRTRGLRLRSTCSKMAHLPYLELVLSTRRKDVLYGCSKGSRLPLFIAVTTFGCR